MDTPGRVGRGDRDATPLRRDARTNQQRILAAATVAVHREGPRVPMATVAAEAGVGVGTLYRRFPTREALLDALTRRSFLLVLDSARAAEARDGTGLGALRHFLDRTIAGRDDLVLPLHGGPAITTDATRAVQSEVHRTLQRVVDRGRRDGSVRDDATPQDVVLFGAMLAQPQPTAADRDRVARRMAAVYVDGLAAPGGAVPERATP
jgi:AcrR family transcriptional regulator